MSSEPTFEALRMSLPELGSAVLSRILTQVCRDPGHPGYGCFDRNWWHYKIRDFPSVILQQGGYALFQASNLETSSRDASALRSIAAASVLFWTKRAVRHGAFEEYYPWEQGYPPLAFGTLAAMKLVADLSMDPKDEALSRAAEIAAGQLLSRFEPRAANQQVAGLAALAWLKKSFPHLVPATELEALAVRTLSLQNVEGWYEEYGGPDVGYLSVTIDCLFDLLDATGDPRFAKSLIAACHFISGITGNGQIHTGMHNARNTDYLVPYGLVRAATEFAVEWPEGMDTVRCIFRDCAKPGHALAAVDDRYLCHYIGQSILRAVRHLESHASSEPAYEPRHATGRTVFENSGHHLWLPANGREFTVLVSARKGGIFTILGADGSAADFGWQLAGDKGHHITHWWSDQWTWKSTEDSIQIIGPFFLHNETESSPFKHVVLRGLSLVFGRSLIGRLKRRLIFDRQQSPYRLERTIRLIADGVIVEDRVRGLRDAGQLTRAPRASKRHVASAESFHPEDLGLLEGFTRSEKVNVEENAVQVETRYSAGSPVSKPAESRQSAARISPK